ncbi:hypothetical protein GCM10025865_21470 [Paraoerskovia sediminicola]|uniref:TIGR03089 family protein n=1 Tax=Paraoerskovia sediminicola TaxID=1138587 RepID=A0ABN6XHA4_9CELL|nr:TIGR03089 family protein [Paraoerskovia sediminicola]BDZ42848.1 hypothetical protein GCM10025865_21470 [Paraoerskovia sediminicola]
MPSPTPPGPTVPAIFRGFSAPGTPRVTWYGDDGERIELSGAVLENWVAKSTNLLVEELDVGPGSTVALDLPVHWRSVVWALASWQAGGTVAISDGQHDPSDGGPGSAADVAVTTRPDAWGSTADVVAVALPALARRYPDPLPAGAVDAASAVMTYADQVGWVPSTDADAPALAPGDGTTSFAELSTAGLGAAEALGAPRAARVLLGPERGLAATLLAVLGVLTTDGSVVLVSPSVADELRVDSDRRARIVGTEHVTVDALSSTAG